MILRFLRLFPQFRGIVSAAEIEIGELKARIAGALVATGQAQKAEAFWCEQARYWQEQYHLEVKEHVKAVETIADFQAQLRFGRKIFDHSPRLPEKPLEDMKPLAKLRQQARVRVQQGTAQFERDYQAYIEKRTREVHANVVPIGTEPPPAA